MNKKINLDGMSLESAPIPTGPQVIEIPATLAKIVDEYVEGRAELDRLEKRLNIKTKEDALKIYAKTRVIDNLSRDSGGTSITMAGKKNSVIVAVTDRPKKITDDRYDEVIGSVGNRGITEDVVYAINPEVYARHKKAIAAALASIDIPEEDRKKLLIKTTTRRFTFSLASMLEFTKKFKLSFQDVFSAYEPTIQIRIK